MKKVALIGYSGHAYVVMDIFNSANIEVSHYCDKSMKEDNPFNLEYLGDENEEKTLTKLQSFDYFVAIGDNHLRENVYNRLTTAIQKPINAIHKSAIVSTEVILEDGIMISANATVNALSRIGKGVICNTGSITEHECILEDFAHVGPGATLCGNVKVGKFSLIGANSVVKQGIKIGRNVIVGMGAVVTKDIPDNVTVIGNPQKTL